MGRSTQTRDQSSGGAPLSFSPGARRWTKRRTAMRKMMPAVPANVACNSQNCVAGISSKKPPIEADEIVRWSVGVARG